MYSGCRVLLHSFLARVGSGQLHDLGPTPPKKLFRITIGSCSKAGLDPWEKSLLTGIELRFLGHSNEVKGSCEL